MARRNVQVKIRATERTHRYPDINEPPHLGNGKTLDHLNKGAWDRGLGPLVLKPLLPQGSYLFFNLIYYILFIMSYIL